MFTRNRLVNFSQDTDVYTCAECSYGTSRKSNFERHLRSSRHNALNRGSDEISEHDNEDSDTDSEFVVDATPAESQSQHCVLLPDNPSPRSFQCDDSEEILHSDVEDTTSEPEDEEPYQRQRQNVDLGLEWFPFESKIHFLLSVLYSSKTHRVSDEVMSYILFVLKESGVSNLPTLARLKNYLQRKTSMEDMVHKHEDTDGNISYVIKPTAMLQLHIANPRVAKSLSRYPTVETSGNLQSSGDKWKTMSFHWARSRTGTDFWRGKFVSFTIRGQRVCGKIVRFLENLQEEKMYVKVSLFLDNSHSSVSDFHVEDNCLVKTNRGYTVALEECEPFDTSNVLCLKDVIDGELVNISMENTGEILETVSPLWKGIPVVNIPVNLFMDDLSANQSRRWSPLHAIQGQISGLPLTEKNQGKNVMFLGLSDAMSMPDLLSPICTDIENCKKYGVEAYDAALNEKVILTTDISLVVTDYQMMSLACNHLGPSAKKFCPKCLADESDPFKKFDLRTKETTCRTLERLVLVRDKAALQTQTGVKLYDNCLWNYMDPHRETPLGMLHFLYLGLAKHLIKFCYQTLKDQQKELVEKHLESMDQSGFSYHVNSSFFKYIDSRQGKDYKHYLQLAVINMEYAGLPKKYLYVLEKLAMISKHILTAATVQVIEKEVEEYLVLLKDTIPELGKKRKTHLCVHLADDMVRHGHPLHYAEDGFEKNHKIIRSSIAHQNGHARSRDTAMQFANNELMIHVISGGFIPEDGEWKSASKQVVTYGSNRKILNFLGLPEDDMKIANGKLRAIIQNQLNDDDFKRLEVQILQAIINNGGSPHLLENRNQLVIQEYKTATTAAGETSKIDNFVLYRDGDQNEKIGQINRFLRLIWKSNSHQVAIVRKVAVLDEAEGDIFQRISVEPHLEVVNVSSLQHIIHAVHDCKRARCHLKEGTVTKKIEQELKSVKCLYLKHTQNNIYVLNKCRFTHSFDKFVF